MTTESILFGVFLTMAAFALGFLFGMAHGDDRSIEPDPPPVVPVHDLYKSQGERRSISDRTTFWIAKHDDINHPETRRRIHLLAEKTENERRKGA